MFKMHPWRKSRCMLHIQLTYLRWEAYIETRIGVSVERWTSAGSRQWWSTPVIGTKDVWRVRTRCSLFVPRSQSPSLHFDSKTSHRSICRPDWLHQEQVSFPDIKDTQLRPISESRMFFARRGAQQVFSQGALGHRRIIGISGRSPRQFLSTNVDTYRWNHFGSITTRLGSQCVGKGVYVRVTGPLDQFTLTYHHHSCSYRY